MDFIPYPLSHSHAQNQPGRHVPTHRHDTTRTPTQPTHALPLPLPLPHTHHHHRPAPSLPIPHDAKPPARKRHALHVRTRVLVLVYARYATLATMTLRWLGVRGGGGGWGGWGGCAMRERRGGAERAQSPVVMEIREREGKMGREGGGRGVKERGVSSLIGRAGSRRRAGRPWAGGASIGDQWRAGTVEACGARTGGGGEEDDVRWLERWDVEDW